MEPSVKEAAPSAGSLSVSAVPLFGLTVRGDECAAALGTGATANSACFKWVRRRNAMSGKLGIPIATPYPARAKFKFGGGLARGVRCAADIPAGGRGSPRCA